ncbi:MAG: exodeoxyribonuclease VII small subunit [Lentisphaeria bacterium]
MAAKKTPDFEKSLEQLEALVHSLEDGELSLEESLKTFEKGINLTRTCQTALKEAEQKVQILIERDGESHLENFDTDVQDS